MGHKRQLQRLFWSANNNQFILLRGVSAVHSALENLCPFIPYLLHINPYFVQRHYHNRKESSKHYYMGTQRIASELMGAPFDADGLADLPLEDPSGMEKTQSGSSYPGSGTFGALSAWSSFDTLLQRLDISTDPNFWDGLQSLLPYQDYFLESQYNDLIEGCEAQTPNPPNQADPECLCANSPFYAWEIHGIECTEYRLLYWYHPDYLGHNEFITDNSGLPYQYFHYSAFGETLVEDNAQYGQFSSPYRFNAKELDGETGNYYYGARYHDPLLGIWLSPDPMFFARPNLTPYNFVQNNPIMFWDPTGLLDSGGGDEDEINLPPILGSEAPPIHIELEVPESQLEPSSESFVAPTASAGGSINNENQSIATPPQLWEIYGESFLNTFVKEIKESTNNITLNREEQTQQLEEFIESFNYFRIKGDGHPVELAAYGIYVNNLYTYKNFDKKIEGNYNSYPSGYVDNPGIPQKPENYEIFQAFGGAPLQFFTPDGNEIMIIITLRVLYLW